MRMTGGVGIYRLSPLASSSRRVITVATMEEPKKPAHEEGSPEPSIHANIKSEEGIIEDFVAPSSFKNALRKLATAGVELRSLEPIPAEGRTHTRYYNVATLFGGSFFSILPYVMG